MAYPIALAEKVYREYMSFFEHAEKARRWSVFDDVPWDKAKDSPPDETLAICAETFCGVEMYLPDYVAQGINVVRESFGQAWFSANWAYEESKHALTLREYLMRTGQRTYAQVYEYESQILGKKWNLPFETARQMTIYGTIQELTTFVIYKKQESMARARGDELLARIYQLIGRDEMAHFGFYAKVVSLLLEEDPEGVKADLAHVFRHFRMPADDLVPSYSDRIAVMREAGIDRGVFIREVWLPVLKRLGLTRHDLPLARAVRPAEAVANSGSLPAQ
jgi:acyl-[acyl-carrier-protein] desaturase